MMEYKKTRRQENETIDLQAKTVSSMTNVLYSRILVFSSSKNFLYSRIPVFQNILVFPYSRILKKKI